MKTSAWLLALLVALALSLTGGHYGAAAQPDARLEFSSDAQTWSATPPELFAGALLVPGEALTEDIWIRHDGEGIARVGLRWDAGTESDTPLEDWVVVSVNGQETPPGQTVPGDTAASGVPTRVQLEVALPASAPNATRDEQIELVSSIAFTAIPPDTSGDPSTGPQRLGETGASVALVIGLAIALLATGTYLRRRLMGTPSPAQR